MPRKISAFWLSVILLVPWIGGPQRALGQAVSGDGVLDEWNSVKVPPPPPLVEVRVDPRNTALLVLDMQYALAGESDRPRAAAAVPPSPRFSPAHEKRACSSPTARP